MVPAGDQRQARTAIEAQERLANQASSRSATPIIEVAEPEMPADCKPRLSTCVMGEIRSMSSGLTKTSTQAVPSTKAPR